MAITIQVGRSSPNIVLESWELVNDRAKRQQVGTINKGESNHVYLRGQPLIISFDKLFLRPPSIPTVKRWSAKENWANFESLWWHLVGDVIVLYTFWTLLDLLWVRGMKQLGR